MIRFYILELIKNFQYYNILYQVNDRNHKIFKLILVLLYVIILIE